MKKKTKKKLVIATAVMALVITLGGVYLMSTEYWVVGTAFFTLGLAWFYAFEVANGRIPGANGNAHPKADVSRKS